jgi:chromosomal replication initiation ATPase DnaA
MAGPMEKKKKNNQGDAIDKNICDFVARLTEKQKMLVVLKAQLYGGSWEPMLDDLKNRLEGKPYIFKLANRIQDDIERIEQLKEFENENNIDLADYVEMP